MEYGLRSLAEGTMYRALIRPLLYLLQPETAHHFAFGVLRILAAIPGMKSLLRSVFHDSSASGVRALGLDFPNRIGLAAGFDKDAIGYEALGATGFGFVEVGTLTGQPQPGNPKPRLFRLPKDRALVNRMGFNNRGSQDAVARLAKPHRTIVGVNIGKTKLVPEEEAIGDYVASATRVGPHADYVVVNVSYTQTGRSIRNLAVAPAKRTWPGRELSGVADGSRGLMGDAFNATSIGVRRYDER